MTSCDRDVLGTYEIYRDYLKHEDGLINWRLGWNFAIQGFLFAGYGILTQGILEQKNGPFEVEATQLVHNIIPLGGLLLALVGFGGIFAAQMAIEQLHKQWAECEESKLPPKLPELTGAGSLAARKIGPLASLGPLAIVCLGWLTIVVRSGECWAKGLASVLVCAAVGYYRQAGVKLPPWTTGESDSLRDQARNLRPPQ